MVPDAAELAAALVEQGVRAVALAVVDPAGITRVKCIPVSRLPEVAENGVGLSTVFTVAMVDDSFASSPYAGGPTGDLRLKPSLGSVVTIGAMPGWAWSPVDQFTQGGGPWGGCPRSFLRSQERALNDAGFRLRAAVEHEFFLGRRGAPGASANPGASAEPSHTGPGYGAEPLTANLAFASDLIAELDDERFGLQQFHPEYAAGQFEVSVAPRDAVDAADTAVAVRQVIRAVARAHSNDVAFAPVFAEGSVGNGAHVHLSLWDRTGEANMLAGGEGPHGLRPEAESFIAGVLRELPALTCVAAPTVVSYGRLQPHKWSGAWAVWGHENREAALRLIAGGPSSANLEVKCVDGAANQYMVLGALIAAGLAGISDDLSLPPGVTEDPSSFSEEERANRGIARLPASLAEAIEALEGSTVMRKAMDPVLLDSFVAARRAEVEAFAKSSLAEAIRAHMWRY